MLEPHTPIPWTPATILHLAFEEDVLFAVQATNIHARFLKALKGVMKSLPNHELPSYRGHYCRESSPCLNCQARDIIEEVEKAS